MKETDCTKNSTKIDLVKHCIKGTQLQLLTCANFINLIFQVKKTVIANTKMNISA